MKKIKGKKFSYSIEKRLLPNGKITTIDVIWHPGAVLIVPFVNKNSVIFLRQYRAVLEKYLYEFPAGTLDPKEKLLTCAKRELAEETGFAARRWRKLGKIYPVPGYSTEVIHIYQAEDLFERQADKDVDEIIETCTFSKHEIREMFHLGQILDAKTICALALCGWI